MASRAHARARSVTPSRFPPFPTLPPPFASIAMLGGYALLGTEFKGPRKVVKNARDKMRKIGNDNGGDEGHEATEGESPSEIEKEFTNGENEKMLDSSIKKGKKKNPVKSVQKKVQKLSKKYVLPVLERACEVYEKFEDKDQVAKEEDWRTRQVPTKTLTICNLSRRFYAPDCIPT